MAKHDVLLQLLNVSPSYSTDEMAKELKKSTYQIREELVKFLFTEINVLPVDGDVDDYKYLYKIFKYIEEPSNIEEQEKLIDKLNELSILCSRRISKCKKNKGEVLRKLKDIIDVSIINLKYMSFSETSDYNHISYKLLDYLIFDLNNYDYLVEILKSFPKKAIAINEDGEYLIDKVIDKYIIEIVCNNDHGKIVYYEKIIKQFIDNPKIQLSVEEKERILSKLKEYITEIKSFEIYDEGKRNILFFINDMIIYLTKKDTLDNNLIIQISKEAKFYKLSNINSDIKSYVISYLLTLNWYMDKGYDNNMSIENYVRERIEKINTMKLTRRQKYILSDFGNKTIDYMNKLEYKKNRVNYLNYKYNINSSFSEKVLEESKRIIDYENEELLDLRKEYVLTIDCPGTNIKDDAISIKKFPDGTCLLSIFVTDAASYIPRGSILDEEAKKRVETIYVPKINLPMIPKYLLKELSLDESENRKVFGYFFLFDKDMKCIDFGVRKCLINVASNLSYDDVNSILTNNKKLGDLCQLKEMFILSDHFDSLNAARQNYRTVKKLRKTIDGDDNIEINDDLGCSMVANFMVLLNSFVADYFNKHPEIPFIYRNNLIHYDENVITHLNEIMNLNNNYSQLSTYLNYICPPSFYSTKNDGHSGLKLPAYCHATNPLRNYSSLEIERIISDYIINKKNPDDTENRRKELQELSNYMNSKINMNNDYIMEYKKVFK